MLVRTLKELLADESVKGFQAENEKTVARALIKKTDPEKVSQMWADAIEATGYESIQDWTKGSDGTMFVVVTNLALPVLNLELASIKATSFNIYGNYHPVIIFVAI